jgi:ParB family chromosome partitioning protein
MQIAELPLTAIEPSSCNPRRRRNKLEDVELMASIVTHGILTPLLVRPTAEADKYQIAAGHRRYSAAQSLGMATVPVQIREMTDIEYLEILHVENLQREDVHPLDEAVGYKHLLEQGGYDVATVAARIGKSEAHVYQRLKLNDLIKEGQKLFLENRIGFGHAVILARLDRKQQKDILANHLFAFQDEAISVRALSEYVRKYLYLDLGNVPWALEDRELVSDAGPCSACPKRTGSNPSLFTDMQHDICTDRACFEKKMAAHVQKQIESRPGVLKFSNYPESHKKDASVLSPGTCNRIWGNRCGSAEEAVTIDGSERGKLILVCRDKECAKHVPQTRRASGVDNAEAAARKKHRIEKAFRNRLFSEIREKVNALPAFKVTRVVARAMWRRLSGDSKRAMLKAAGEFPGESVEQFGDRLIEKANPVSLGRMMVCMAIADELMVSTFQPGKAETMLSVADLYGIDVKAVREGAKTAPKSKPSTARKQRPQKARAAA